MTRLQDVIAVRRFAPVVQAADIHALRAAPTSTDTADFVRGYLGFDDRARYALETVLHSLASGSGGAFFLNGVFGSGKSHFLGLIALLSDGIAHNAFLESHPHLAPLVHRLAPRFVVHFSLDEYSAARFSLEEIFWREIGREWTRRGFNADELALAHEARGETFAAFDELLRTRGFTSWLICMDELSLFLSGREHRALQQDAAFLQFLGQRARRSASGDAARCSLHLVAALQKTVEDIGDIDAYALSQIRDRFSTLPLSLAHLPSLIERRLIEKVDPDRLACLNEESFKQALAALPRLDFGRDEWQRLYPFHPATVSALEAIASRFGSRTRSAVVFCQQALHPERDATQRVLPDELFDYLEPELHTYPDLKALVALWQAWPEQERDLALDEREAHTLRRLVKAMLLFKIAGIAPSVAQVANALLLDARLPGEGNYEYTRMLLEKIRLHAGGLAVERREGAFADRYTLDSGARIGELARRYTGNALRHLPQRDSRIGAYVLSCCRTGALPLATISGPGCFDVIWSNTTRRVRVELVEEPPPAAALANTLAAMTGPRGHDLTLYISLPFGRHDQHLLHEQWRETAAQAAGLWNDTPEAHAVGVGERWRYALAWWIPREASIAEWDEAREATAQNLLLQDVQLNDNRRGRAVLDHLRSGLSEREAGLARLAECLLREGGLSHGGEAYLEAGDLALGETWNSVLEAVASWCLREVFPYFPRIAPRLRVLTAGTSDTLCLEVLRRPAESPYFAPSREREVRAVAQPLGIAIEAEGRWRINAPHEELVAALHEVLSEGAGRATWLQLEQALAKSPWGIDALQTRLVACALLRSGALAAFDTRGQLVPAREIGLPLERSVHHLRKGELLDASNWEQLKAVFAVLTEEPLGALSFEEQEHAVRRLENWSNDALAQTELAQARLVQLQRHLQGNGEVWQHARETLHAVGQRALALRHGEPGVAQLQQVATWPTGELQLQLQRHRLLAARLEASQAAWLHEYAFLTHPDLHPPAEQSDARAHLLSRFPQALEDGGLLDDAQAWRHEYATQYSQWHQAQHDSGRWLSFQRLRHSDDLRALELLGSLTTRSFPQARNIQLLLDDELAKQCRFDGQLHGEPVCPNCRLKWGERLTLRNPAEVEAAIAEGLHAFRQALHDPHVATFLQRSTHGALLVHWGQSDSTDLLPLLSDTTISLLEEAFLPRRTVPRSWTDLHEGTKECRTRGEWHRALLAWLDADDSLSDDDEIVVGD